MVEFEIGRIHPLAAVSLREGVEKSGEGLRSAGVKIRHNVTRAVSLRQRELLSLAQASHR